MGSSRCESWFNRMSLRCIAVGGWVAAFALVAGAARGDAPTSGPTTQPIKLVVQASSDATKPARLLGRDAHQQLIVTAQLGSGDLRDYTRAVRYAAQPPEVAQISATGDVTPLQ